MSVRRAVAFVFVGTLVLCGAASAEVIVDTGTPPDASSAWTIGFGQSLAGEITLEEAWSITDIEIYMFTLIPGDVTLAIYGDNGHLPDISSLFYSTSFFPDSSPSPAWVGANGLSWDLDAGTYWVAFEPAGNVFAAAPIGAPVPLDFYAYNIEGAWSGAVADNWGLRVQGTPVESSVVPEPATLTLCALGLAGFAGRAYRRGMIFRQISFLGMREY